MPVLIVFRSLTYAQRAFGILQRNGIPAALVKAPAGSWEKGCAYALRMDIKRLHSALAALSAAGLSFLRVIRTEPSGAVREVTL